MTWVVVFLIYWLVLFVACYVVVDYGQSYFYEEKTGGTAWRVGGGSLLLAILWTRYSWINAAPEARAGSWYDQVFTSTAAWLLLMAILAFVIFTLLYQFHAQHALYLGPVTVLILGGMGSMAADSLSQTGGAASVRTERRVIVKPQRKAIGSVPPTAGAAAPPPSPPPALKEALAPRLPVPPQKPRSPAATQKR